MNINLDVNGNLMINKNTTIFNEGQSIKNLFIFRKGENDIYIKIDENDINNWKLFSIPANIVLGIANYNEDNKLLPFTLKAKTDNEVYIVKIETKEDLKKFFENNKTYLLNINQSTNYILLKFNDAYLKIKKISDELKNITTNLALTYYNFASKKNTFKSKLFTNAKMIFNEIKNSNFTFPDTFDENFIKTTHYEFININNDEKSEEIKQKRKKTEMKVDYVRRLLTMPKDIKKTFFTYDISISLDLTYMIYEESLEIINAIKESMNDIVENINFLYSEDGESLFQEYKKEAKSLEKQKKDNEIFIRYSRLITNIAKEYKNIIQKEYEYNIEIDEQKMEETLEELNTCLLIKKEEHNNNENNVEVIMGAESIPDEIKNASRKILELADIDSETLNMFEKTMNEFKKLKDKFSTDDEARKIRRTITNIFFEVYKVIARKYIEESEKTPLTKMFLNYGFMDETLLTPNQVIDLYELKEDSLVNYINVYHLDEWLQMIYDKEEPPSVNGFGQDYREALREMKKRAIITNEELEEYWENPLKRLEYEIDNMILTTHRLCYGQVSVYFPILYSDMITKDIKSAYVSKNDIQRAIKNVIDVDFSAFYREVLYRNKDLNIDKELVMQEILPNIILMPTFGAKSIMWQELATKQKNSKGRFLYPIFTSEDLEALTINTIAAFRWELCKTILGPSWNDISQLSLTSEYSDYVQFYKKNRALSNDAKEKMKIQIKKARNNLKEVFISDYNLWMKYERNGIMKLNKVSRGILFRHVPFAKEIRDELEKQPMFSDIANKFKNIRAKKATEVEFKYHKFTKTGNPLPEELENCIKFYKEL